MWTKETKETLVKLIFKRGAQTSVWEEVQPNSRLALLSRSWKMTKITQKAQLF